MKIIIIVMSVIGRIMNSFVMVGKLSEIIKYLKEMEVSNNERPMVNR